MKTGYQEYKSRGQHRWRVRGRNNKKLANGGEAFHNEKDMKRSVILTARALLAQPFVQEALKEEIALIANEPPTLSVQERIEE